MSAQHTPGPWKVVVDEHPHHRGGTHVERRIFTAWDHPQLKASMGIVNMSVGIGEQERSTRHMVAIDAADAHLIAAAPDLLAALKSLLVHAERANEIMLHEAGVGVCDLSAMDAARAAIAKAVGAAEQAKEGA